MMALRGYDRWKNFVKVIDKTKTSCENSKIELESHFRDVTKMVNIGSDAEYPVSDVILSRYAWYR